MNLYITIIALGLLIFFSHVFNELFNKTKIPNVLLLLLIGIIVGPVSGIVTKDFFGKLGSVFTTITLIVILFESGSGLKMSEIKKSIGSASLLTILNFLATISVTVIISRLFLGMDSLSAAFVGAIIGGTSSAVVIPMVRQLKLGEKSTSVLILESAISDVLCLVVGLALLDGIAEGAVSIGFVFSKMWKSFLFAILIGLGSGLIWSFLLQLIRSVKNSMFTTLAFVFVLYGFVELLSLNGGLSVLTFGILLGNVSSLVDSPKYQKFFNIDPSGFNTNEQSFFSEVVFIMQTYFFVYVGISLQFGNLLIYLVGLILVGLIIIVRFPVIKFFIRKEISLFEKSIMSVMTPKGLVPAVLASIPLQRGLAHGEKIMDLGYSVVLFSIIICSILVILIGLKNQKTKAEPEPENSATE